ncbi:MAG: Dabb family protein, partial [Armatimonadota bacterium]
EPGLQSLSAISPRRTQMPFHHHVYFYPTETPGADDAVRLEALIRTYLAGIPDVISLGTGRPAGTDRTVVDNDYMLALLLTFPDAEAEKRYQVHPDHVAFGRESRPLWSRVRVYDTIEE